MILFILLFVFLEFSVGLFTDSPAFASGNGSAVTNGSVVVSVATNVNCTSSTVTVAPGTQTTTLTVVCTLSGNPNNLNSNTNNFTYPASISSNIHTLAVTPIVSVTSPDNSVTGITGSYNSFNGTLNLGTANVWKVQSSSTVNTTATTPAGTYTGTVTYNWSTL